MFTLLAVSGAQAESIFYSSTGTPRLILNGGGPIGATDQGWYSSAGEHSPGNGNYITGDCSDCGDGLLYRSFFVFAIPDIAITSATFRVNTATYDSFDPSEFLALFEVTTDIAALTAGGLGFVSTYNDLGTGPLFGTQVFTAADGGLDVDVTLNATAIAALNGARNGQFAMGGALTSLGGPSEVPEPGTLSLLGLGAIGLALGRRRKK